MHGDDQGARPGMRTDGGPGFHQVIFADRQTPAQCGEHALGLGPGIAMTHDDAPTRACRQLADHAVGEGFRRTVAREQQARDLHATFGIHSRHRRQRGEACDGCGPAWNAATAHGMGNIRGDGPHAGQRAQALQFTDDVRFSVALFGQFRGTPDQQRLPAGCIDGVEDIHAPRFVTCSGLFTGLQRA